MNRVERTALVSAGINAALVVLKVFLATLSGSLALVADAWHSGSDVAASGLVWAGARLSRRGGRSTLAVAENVVGVVIAALILLAAVGIFRRVSALSASPINRIPIAIGGSLVAAVISYYAAQYKLHVGRQEHSLSLIADGYHSRMDTLTTGAVIVGLMGTAIGVPLDRIAAVVVALFVVESAVVILASAAKGLRQRAAAGSAAAGLVNSGFVRVSRRVLTKLGLHAVPGGLARAFRRRGTRRRLALGAGGAVAIVWLATGLSFVGPGSVGVAMRWGRANEQLLEPGLHIKAPWPIDRVIRLDAPKVRRIEIGFRTRPAAHSMSTVAAEFYATLWESRHAAGTYEKIPDEALRLTGDENIVDMNTVVFYTIDDPLKYLFRVAQSEDLVRFTVESVISRVAGGLSLDEILTLRRGSFEQLILDASQSLLDAEEAGVRLCGVRLQDVHPPLEVVPSFRDVASAREDKVRIINVAQSYMEETVPKARGAADSLVLGARGYSADRTGRAVGDADRFTQMERRFRDAPDVNRERLYIETMEGLLAGKEKYIVSSDVELEGYDFRVLDKEISPDAAARD
jgi:modulator of FtsH protease HflK